MDLESITLSKIIGERQVYEFFLTCAIGKSFNSYKQKSRMVVFGAGSGGGDGGLISNFQLEEK